MKKASCCKCNRTLDDKRSLFPRHDKNGKICLFCEPVYLREINQKTKPQLVPSATREDAIRWLIGQENA